MVKILNKIEKLQLENSNLKFQITEYQQIVKELSDQLKKYKTDNKIKSLSAEDKK